MLSGRWDDFGGQLPIMGSLKFCSRHSWRLKGDFQQSLLGGSLIIFDFGNVFEPERVWPMGSSLYKGRSLQLDWWRLDARCFREGVHDGEVWVMVLGLLVHLWGTKFFERL